jgi:hypothetical protein
MFPAALTTNGKRASRTGPSELMKYGIAFRAPSSEATATWGFAPMLGYALTLGLDPPAPGWAWQLTQLLELNPGPSPLPGSFERLPSTESVW